MSRLTLTPPPIERSFPEVYSGNRESMIGRLIRKGTSREDAEDAVQEAAIECWLRLNRPDMDEVCNVFGWLSKAATRIASKKRHAEFTADLAAVLAAPLPPSDGLEHREEKVRILKVIRSLPDRQRRVVYRLCVKRCAYRAVEQRLGMTTGAVTHTLARARRTIWKALDMPDKNAEIRRRNRPDRAPY